ncbi:MAG: hypothetical protein WBN04_03800 [Paracoccaceae bacterium]
MTISPELFYSILSMDAYNRGYDPSIEGLGEDGSIGNATLLTRTDIGISDDEYSAWSDASFSAIAHQTARPCGVYRGASR